MSLMRIAARATLAVLVLVGALVIGNALREARTPTISDRTSLPIGNALAASTPSPTPGTANCAQLGALAPRIPPPLDVTDMADGTKRVTSGEAGYAITIPSSWLVMDSLLGATPGVLGPTRSFGQAHITSYDPRTAPTPDPERWMLPASVGISVDVQVWMNPLHEKLDAFAQRVLIGPDQKERLAGSFLRIDGRTAYRFTIQDEHRFQPQDGPLVVTRQTRIVWLVESAREDRVIVAYATPGESGLFATVERAVSAMKVATPFAILRPVTHQRDEILKQWLYDKSGAKIAGRRVEAKLMTYWEATAGMYATPGTPGGPTPQPSALPLLRIDHDPDDWFWVVAVSGGDLPQGRGGPGGFGAAAGTPPPTAWILFDTSATGDNTAGTGMQIASRGTWPPQFDALADRCR